MLLLQIIIATLVVSSISLVGIFTLYKNAIAKNSVIKIIISIAAGSLLAISFWELIPESLQKTGNSNMVMSVVFISFLIFFIFEKYWHWHHCQCDDACDCHNDTERKNLIYTNLIGDGIHNLIDGFLIASAFMLNFNTGLLTTVAVIIHEIPHEITDYVILIYAGMKKGKALLYNLIFALTAVIGGIAFYFFGQNFKELIPYMTAFAAGNFIYLAASDLIPELHHEKNPKKIWQQTIWLIVGVIAIYCLIKFLPD